MKNKLMLIALSLVSVAQAGIEFSPKTGRYVDTKTGRFVKQAASTISPVLFEAKFAALKTIIGLAGLGTVGYGLNKLHSYMNPAKELSRTERFTNFVKEQSQNSVNFVKAHKYSTAGALATVAGLGYLAYKGYFKNPFAKKAKKSAPMTYAQRRAALCK